MALRGAGMVPPEKDQDQRHKLFATHTTLLLAAQAITNTLRPSASGSTTETTPTKSPNGLEGLTSWIHVDEVAHSTASDVVADISRFDWRGSARDHLRDAFHTLIDRQHRKEFGEYYTPDWLAEDVVKNTLDEPWLDGAIAEACERYPIEHGTILEHDST